MTGHQLNVNVRHSQFIDKDGKQCQSSRVQFVCVASAPGRATGKPVLWQCCAKNNDANGNMAVPGIQDTQPREQSKEWYESPLQGIVLRALVAPLSEI